MEKAIILSLLLFVATATRPKRTDLYDLTIKVRDLRNSEGSVIFAIYNRDGTIPDENFKDYYKKQIAKISGNKAQSVFSNLPMGKYAVSILHDENNNGKIDKKFMLPLPKEGVGFSNYDDFGLTNRPNFEHACFYLDQDTVVTVKIIYK